MRIIRILSLAVLILGISLIAAAPKVQAATFDPGRIIDDTVFTNKNAMSESQIQAFLEAKGSTCLKDFRTLALYDDNNDGYGDEPYGRGNDNNKVLASKLIYQAAQIYDINPQVILATLEKEQRLITRNDCPSWRYNTALGYGCPDTEPCSVSAYGFTRQIDYGVWHFRGFYDDNLTYVPYSPGVRKVYFHPGPCRVPASGGGCDEYYGQYKNNPDINYCGSTNVNIKNRATASLYSYTPYQPNQASLDAFPGTGDRCSSYGNRNFWFFFTNWFGSTSGPFYTLESQTLPDGEIAYGEVVSVQFKIKNNSSLTWYSDGNLPQGQRAFRLMTTGYKNTVFANTSDPAWMGTQNQVKMVEASVAPGQIATFNFTLKAPQQSLSHTIDMVLVHNGVRVYTDTVMSVAVKSIPDYAYETVSIEAPRGILPGDGNFITVKLKNTGVETWHSDDNRPPGVRPIRLAASGYRNSPFAYPRTSSAWLGTRNQIKLQEPKVAPGEVGTFRATIFAPYQEIKEHEHNFRLVLDGEKFIPGLNIPVTISVPPIIPRYSIVSTSGVPSTLSTGEQATFSVTVRNEGNMIWRNARRKVPSDDPAQGPLRDVRMLTWDPGYRNSAFASSTWEWLGSKNQISAATKIAGPGKNATYDITFTAPNTPGQYVERFNLVLDGLVVFPNQGLSFPITVTP
ncbi:MAG: hypothetical protein WD467_02155 [Candidatus Saccharimonadales bacterium]